MKQARRDFHVVCFVFKQIWPDQGDWNFTVSIITQSDDGIIFKQIWPDQGDWNKSLTAFSVTAVSSALFKQIWPDQGD